MDIGLKRELAEGKHSPHIKCQCTNHRVASLLYGGPPMCLRAYRMDKKSNATCLRLLHPTACTMPATTGHNTVKAQFTQQSQSNIRLSCNKAANCVLAIDVN